MTKTTHTPGPWRILGGVYKQSPIPIVAHDIHVANAGDFKGSVPQPEKEANARLIAAAPDMHDLAKNVGGFDDSLLRSADLNVLRATLREFREQARAAIAKAEGRS